MAADKTFSDTINYAKGLAILLVVLGHINSPLGTAIFSFHIPLFFFLGGVFVKTDYVLSEFLRRNFVRLIIPYFIFGTLGLAVNDVKDMLLQRPLENLWYEIAGLLFWMDASRLKHYGLVLWFLPALFWARTMSYGIMRYSGSNEWIGLLICAACAYGFSGMAGYLPFGLDKGMVALPWVFAGYVFSRHRERILHAPIWLAVLAAALVAAVAYWDMPHLDLASKNLDHFYVTLPYTFCVIFLAVYAIFHAVLGGTALIKSVPAVFGQFGSQSMLVYVAHPYTNNAAYLLATHFLGEGYWFIKFLVTASMLLVLVRVRQRYPDFLLFRYV